MKQFKPNNARHMVITPVVRISFPRLFTPRAYQNDPKAAKMFSCDLIFDAKEQLSEKYTGKKMQTVSVRDAIQNAIVDFWGTDKKLWPAGMVKPIKDGNQSLNKSSGEPNNGYAEKFYVSANTGEKFPPKIVDLTGRPLEEKDVYGGCYVRACLVASAYGVGTKGVKFYLNQIMKVKDGEPFGGAPRDVFDYGDDSEADDVFGNTDDNEDDFL